MFSLKKGSEEDVDSLIESMLRLIEYMNQNPAFKRDIFKSFSPEDLNKILKNMEDTNIKLRKVSSLFLCSILTNTENCDKFCAFQDLLPVAGKLSVTSIPEKLVKTLQTKPKLLTALNQFPITPYNGEQPFCWYYSSAMARDGQQSLGCFYPSQLKDIKHFFNDFADPADCLIGVVYTPSRVLALPINSQISHREQSNSPQSNSVRRSIDTYRPLSATMPQQSPIKSRYNQIPIDQVRKSQGIPTQVVSSHSPGVRMSASPQQQTFASNLINKSKVHTSNKSQTTTPVTSYQTFLNAQRLKMENGRYTSDKQKSNPVAKSGAFDFLKHRLSDNMNAKANPLSQSKLKSSNHNTSFNVSSPVQSPNNAVPNPITEQRPTTNQDWRSVNQNNYGMDWRSTRGAITGSSGSKKNVVKIRLN